MAMTFEQANLPVLDEQGSSALRSMIETAVEVNTEKFLDSMQHFGLKIREFEKALHKGLLERAAGVSGMSAVYAKLPMSDQAQMRELYLTKVEDIEESLREKYKKLYRYA